MKQIRPAPTGSVAWRWLDAIPLIPLAIGAVLLGLAPVSPEPHLWQKLKLLTAGRLTQPVDIFDLLMHGGLPLLLLLKLIRQQQLRRQTAEARKPR